MRRVLALTILAVLGCRSLPEDRGSALAAEAGNKTVVLGSCNQEPVVGWSVCRLERGGYYPPLRLWFVNPGNYAVSDCFNGIYVSGAARAGEMITIPMEQLSHEVESLGFCFLKVDTIERWEDESGHKRSTSMAGGFVIELFDRGYIPTPPRDLVAFCRKFGRTTKGRTVSEKCKVQ